MNRWRDSVVVIGVVVTALASSPAAAPRPRIFWRDQQRIEVDSRQMKIRDLPSDPRPDRIITLPPECLWATWRADAAYALVRKPPADGGGLEVRVCSDGRTWNLLAMVPKAFQATRAVLPLSDGALLLVPSFGLFTLGEQGEIAAPFIKLSRDGKGDWNLATPLGLDWGVLHQELGPGNRPHYHLFGRYLFTFSAVVETPELSDRLFEFEDGFAFLDRHHGLIWIFNDAGELKTRISLYEDLKDEELDQDPIAKFPVGILACEAAPDGLLWIAGRTEPAFFFARKNRPMVVHGAVTPLELEQARISELEFPDLQWWRVDLKAGQAAAVSAPQGAPARVPTGEDHLAKPFHFTVGADGRLAFGPSGSPDPEGPEPKSPGPKPPGQAAPR